MQPAPHVDGASDNHVINPGSVRADTLEASSHGDGASQLDEAEDLGM